MIMADYLLYWALTPHDNLPRMVKIRVLDQKHLHHRTNTCQLKFNELIIRKGCSGKTSLGLCFIKRILNIDQLFFRGARDGGSLE